MTDDVPLPSSNEVLLGRHAARVIVERELGVEDRWTRFDVDVVHRLVNGDQKGTAVLLIVGYFDVLQEYVNRHDRERETREHLPA